MALWILTRGPTGPRRGTTVLIRGAASVLIAFAAVVVHFWIRNTDASDSVVLLVRLAALLAPLVWAALVVAYYREERRVGTRTHGAKAGLVILTVATLGVVAAMLPGLIESLATL